MLSTNVLANTSFGLIAKTGLSTGNYDVIDHGIFHSFDSDSSAEIEEIFTNGFHFTIKIIFKKNESGKYEIQRNTDLENNIIVLECYNFDNSLGTGTIKPIEIGDIEGKKLFFHFWVFLLGGNKGSLRKIEYTLLKER